MGMFLPAVESGDVSAFGSGNAVATGDPDHPGRSAKLPHLRVASGGNRLSPGEAQAARQRSILAELLAPCDRPNAEAYATKLLNTFGGLGRVFAASREALDYAAGSPGIGAIVATARQAYQEALRDGVKGSLVDTADPGLHRYLAARLGTLSEERMHAVFVDGLGRYISDETIAAGGSGAVPLRCRALFQRALALEASAILLAHNHPSGSSDPSPEDVAVTQELVRIARQLEIKIVDHLIVTSSKVFSMKRAGLL